MKTTCPIKGVDEEDCKDCSGEHYESCFYYNLKDALKALRTEEGKPFEPVTD